MILRDGGSERVACPSAGLTVLAAKRRRHRENLAMSGKLLVYAPDRSTERMREY
jgi:hypothetical protein